LGQKRATIEGPLAQSRTLSKSDNRSLYWLYIVVNRLVKLFFPHIFMKMSAARILVHLTLSKNFRKLSYSNTLGYLLKLYKVDK